MCNLTNVEIIEKYNIFPSINVKIPEIFGSFILIELLNYKKLPISCCISFYSRKLPNPNY